VLYLSYNTQPGWSAFMPLRDLLVQHTQLAGNEEQGLPTAARIEAALAFAAQIFETDPVYAQANPSCAIASRSCSSNPAATSRTNTSIVTGMPSPSPRSIAASRKRACSSPARRTTSTISTWPT
jgi:hypothetical protein